MVEKKDCIVQEFDNLSKDFIKKFLLIRRHMKFLGLIEVCYRRTLDKLCSNKNADVICSFRCCKKQAEQKMPLVPVNRLTNNGWCSLRFMFLSSVKMRSILLDWLKKLWISKSEFMCNFLSAIARKVMPWKTNQLKQQCPELNELRTHLQMDCLWLGSPVFMYNFKW